MKLISGYTDAAEQRHWRESCEREARAKYDAARAKILEIADEFRGIEDVIADGIADQDDARGVMEYLTGRAQKLSELYVEVHRWKVILKKEFGVDP